MPGTSPGMTDEVSLVLLVDLALYAPIEGKAGFRRVNQGETGIAGYRGARRLSTSRAQ